MNRPEHRDVFAQIFRLYWRDPRYLEHMMSMMLLTNKGVQKKRAAHAAEKRAAEALLDGLEPDFLKRQVNDKKVEKFLEIDASCTISEKEKLKTLDFEQMSNQEISIAKKMIARLTLPVRPRPSRRMSINPNGKYFDKPATLRHSIRQGGDILDLFFKNRKVYWPNLIVLCNISGSMRQYSRILLHFLHTVANHKGAGWAKVCAFTFGTRLTYITRHLCAKDTDAALAAVGPEAQDWEGGTRIAMCLHQFNNDWARRVVSHGAVVLLITDGLDRDRENDLAQEMQRLHLRSKRLIWLNTLLGWDKFLAKTTGIRAMLPHVDSFRASHSIASLKDLAKIISSREDTGEKNRLLKSI